MLFEISLNLQTHHTYDAMHTLDQLRKGSEAVINRIENHPLAARLLEMALPGRKVKVLTFAPFGGPLAIEIAGSLLSLRRQEARLITVS